MAHSLTERISREFSRFFATSPALIIGVAVFAALVAALYWRARQTVRLGLTSGAAAP